MNSTIPCKRIILEVLDYLRYQVDNDRCTPEEMRSFANTIEDNLDIECTVQDIAERYKQSPSNVRNVLSRNFMPKPKRRVHYSFSKFIKFIPKSWVRSVSGADVDMEASERTL